MCVDNPGILPKYWPATRIRRLFFRGAMAAVRFMGGGYWHYDHHAGVGHRTHREMVSRLTIGARTHDVLTSSLVELMVLSTMGGVIGLILGVGCTWMVTQQLDMPSVWSPGIMLWGFSFSVAIGIIFGFFLARKAAGLNARDALRHE